MNDLHVVPISDSLSGRRLDVVVTGSIASIESVRLIRSLRRLGAEVTPWLSQGGASFITPMSLSWAAGQETTTSFSGDASHICQSDGVIVAPASANFLTKISRGITDSPTSALVTSALGQKKPVIMLPAMHDSLMNAPAIKEHLERISKWPGIHMMSARLEEGKQKFPDPSILADEISHAINSSNRSPSPILLTMGTTRGYIDDVRYLSNYSSGKLGTLIAEELYRKGHRTRIIAGPCEYTPNSYSTLIKVKTTGDMLSEALLAETQGLLGGIFCASVLDYEPAEQTKGKIRSGTESLSIKLKPTPKIIGKISLNGRQKIGFKLEVGLSESSRKRIAEEYLQKYNLSCLILNELSAVNASDHHAFAHFKDGRIIELKSKAEIAQFIGRSFF